MDEELGDLEEEFEAAGEAASAFEDSLASLPSALLSTQAAAAQAGTAARDAQGRFIAAGDGAKKAGAGAMSMGGAMQKAAGAISSIGKAALAIATGSMPSATQAGAQLGEAIGGALTGAADKAAGALSALGPEGEAVGEALQAVTAVAAATIGTLATLAGIAIDVTQELGLMTDRFAALSGSAAGGAAVTAMVQNLSKTLPFATAQIASWATSLEAAGFKGAQLESSIKAVAAASALMGDQGAAAASNLMKKLAEGGDGAKKLLDAIQKGSGKSNKLLADMGLSSKDLAAAMGMTDAAFAKATISADQMNAAIAKALQKKGAGPLEDLGNTVPEILGKAKEGILSLFDGLGPSVKPFMAEVKAFFGEFSKGGTAINTLKPIVTSVFSTLFSWATTATHAIHAGFLMITIAALKVYIAMKPMIDRLKQLAQSSTFITGLKVVLFALALPFLLIAVNVLIAAAAVALIVAGFVILGGIIAEVVGAIVGFVGDAASAIADWVSGAASAASDFVAGLVNGIVSGAASVVSAVSNLASSALGAFTGALGIHSPSTIMLEHGEDNIAGAAATGVKKGTSKVEDAMAKMGSSEPGSPDGKSGGGSGKKEYHFHYDGPVESYPVFRENMHRWLEETGAEALPS